MGSIRSTTLYLLACLCAQVQYVLAVSLSDFQPIASFPPACMAVWEAPIPGCTVQDFAGSQTCSSTCIRGLQILTGTVNQACTGVRVESDTLIGLFFQNLGVTTLCSNANSNGGSSSSQSSGGGGLVPVPAKSSQRQTSPTAAAGSVTASTTAEPSTTTSSSSGTSTSESTTTGPTTIGTTSNLATQNTVKPTLQLSFSGAGEGHTQTVTSATSTTSPLGSSETQGFGGSGNAFDILAGSAAGQHEVSMVRTLVMAGGVLVAVCWTGSGW